MDTAFLEQLFGLEGQVAVVTGGGGVLCGAMARALARVGACVAVLDLNVTAAQAIASEITAAGGEALAAQTNVLERTSLERALAAILERWGRLDILVNGAGGNRAQATTSAELSFFDLPEEAFREVLSLNLLGTVLPCQVFGRQMAAQGGGVILNIASVNGFRPLTEIPAYSTAKAAVSNFTQWLAVHMARHYSPRIRVNALAPGFVLTEQNRYLLIDVDGRLTPRAQAALAHTPLGRFGLPEDLLGAALWLVSPAAAFVQGTVVAVDGGFLAYGGV